MHVLSVWTIWAFVISAVIYKKLAAVAREEAEARWDHYIALFYFAIALATGIVLAIFT
jgi:hypothetical protein